MTPGQRAEFLSSRRTRLAEQCAEFDTQAQKHRCLICKGDMGESGSQLCGKGYCLDVGPRPTAVFLTHDCIDCAQCTDA